jgi:hypothetical protein
MHQNTSLTTPDRNKYLFWKKNSGILEVCANASKHVFYHSRRSKISFLKKSFWCFWWSGSMWKCIKTQFYRSRRSKLSFLKKSFWYSGSMRKCIKTRFSPLQTFKNIFFEKKFLVFLVVWKYVKMHQNTFFTTPDGQNYLFWKKVSGGLEVCANAWKHVFNHSRC